MSPLCASKPRCVAPVEAVLGEGPIWDPRIACLLFLDIKGGKIFVYDPQTEETRTFEAPGKVSAIGLRRKGGYICARKDGFARLTLGARAVEIAPLAEPEKDKPGNRFNDGKVDLAGGFWAGTMDEKEKVANAGSWWRLASDGAVEHLDAGFHITNGPAFDPDRHRVYFTDSARQTIFAAKVEDGGFRDKRTFLTFGAGEGYPDGMDVDRVGNLWVAFWDGAAVRRFSPEGALIETIETPALRPTSIVLVEDRAYITSALIGLSADQIDKFPLSGGLFEVRLNAPMSQPVRYFEG